jgi:hypothetical protein
MSSFNVKQQGSKFKHSCNLFDWEGILFENFNEVDKYFLQLILIIKQYHRF